MGILQFLLAVISKDLQSDSCFFKQLISNFTNAAKGELFTLVLTSASLAADAAATATASRNIIFFMFIVTAKIQ